MEFRSETSRATLDGGQILAKEKDLIANFFCKNLNYPGEKLLVCVDQRTSVISLCNNRIFLTVFVCLILILP